MPLDDTGDGAAAANAAAKAGKDVVILIHGTGAAEPDLVTPKWWQSDSEFAKGLRTRLGPGFDVGESEASAPFKWSGNNSERDRRAAGRDLQRRLAGLEKRGVGYHLVGHSHGGSVIWHALRLAEQRGIWSRLWNRMTGREKSLDGLKSWTTVGTPFLEYQPLWHGLLWVIALIVCVSVPVVYNRDWFSHQIDAKLAWRDATWFGQVLFYIHVGLMGLFLLMLAVLSKSWIGKWIADRRHDRAEAAAARKYGQHWLALWHPHDEPISGLSATLVKPLGFAPRISIWKPSGPLWVRAGIWMVIWPYWLMAWTIGRPLIWLYDRLTAPVINQFVWGVSMARVQGSDINGLTMVDASHTPLALAPGLSPLPATIMEEMNTKAGTNAAATAQALRTSLAGIRANGDSDDALQKMAASISWTELLHTSYFDYDSVRDLIACHIQRKCGLAVPANITSLMPAAMLEHKSAPPAFRPLQLAVSRTVAAYVCVLLLWLGFEATVHSYFLPQTMEGQARVIAERMAKPPMLAGRSVSTLGDVLVRLETISKVSNEAANWSELPSRRSLLDGIFDPNTRSMAAQRLAYAMGHAGRFADVTSLINDMRFAERKRGIDPVVSEAAIHAHALAGAHDAKTANSKPPSPALIEQTVVLLNQVKASSAAVPAEIAKLLAVAVPPLKAFSNAEAAQPFVDEVADLLVALAASKNCKDLLRLTLRFEPGELPERGEKAVAGCAPQTSAVRTRAPAERARPLNDLLTQKKYKEATELVLKSVPVAAGDTDQMRALGDSHVQILDDARLLLAAGQRAATTQILSYYLKVNPDPAKWSQSIANSYLVAQKLAQYSRTMDRERDVRELAEKIKSNASKQPQARDKLRGYGVAAMLYNGIGESGSAQPMVSSALDALSDTLNRDIAPNQRLEAGISEQLHELSRQVSSQDIARKAKSVNEKAEFLAHLANARSEDFVRLARAFARIHEVQTAREMAELAGPAAEGAGEQRDKGGVLEGYVAILDAIISAKYPTRQAQYGLKRIRDRLPVLAEPHVPSAAPAASRRAEGGRTMEPAETTQRK